MCAMPYADPDSRRFVRLALSREAGALLARLAAAEGRSQRVVVERALAAYAGAVVAESAWSATGDEEKIR